jgi:pyruvate/2-oxoglutarate/acetoin dehydrogenase E1 component
MSTSIKKYWQAINSALAEEMRRDARVCVLGEDVGTPGGPFGATRGLLDEFGEWRVRDTPIAENSLVGLGVGSAMAGMRPVIEVMFLDFMALAMDQVVNQAAKVRYMSGGSFSVPMVIRCLVGSERSAGPQHAQNLEAWLTHVPGLKVCWPATPADAKGLLTQAIRDDDPVIVLESLSLWGVRGEVPDGEHVVPLGHAASRVDGSDVSLITWGGACRRAIEAAELLTRDGISIEVIDLRSLLPIDEEAIVRSVRKTRRALVVHDAVRFGGFGAEVTARIYQSCFQHLAAPVVRLGALFAPSPFPAELESTYLPSTSEIAAAAADLVRAA